MSVMKRIFIAIATAVLPALFAMAAGIIEVPRFVPHPPMLGDAVREADVIFMGVTTRVDLSGYDSNGKGTYSGTITPQTFLKGSLNQREVNLAWEPSATSIEPGSNHMFFVRIKNGGFEVVKEIFFHQPPYKCSRTYWAYDGGADATVQTIKLLVSPSTPQPDYAATLLADLQDSSGQRQATAVMLACETLRPECLDPLLYAITHHVEYFDRATYGACRLDGKKGASAALGLIASHPNDYGVIFEAIAAAKNAQSVPIVEQFGNDLPEYRASCAVAIGAIEPSKLAELTQRWHVDGKSGSRLRHFEGRVVRRASGGFDLSNGFYCASFPKEKTASLAPYLGKFVDAAFSERPRFGWGGESFDEIQRITVIEETPEAFPIEVTIEPGKAVFASSEPIVAKVVLHNRSPQVQSFWLISSHAVLSQDYEKAFWLEPDSHYYNPEKSYRFEGKPDLSKLDPGGSMAFTIESRHMAEPGKYDLSYVLTPGVRERNCVSESVPVAVVSAADADRVAVLRSWLKTAALEQRITIANELAEKGDQWAVDEFLAQLKTGMYLGNGFFYHRAYVFPFRHGGKAGEKLMMDLIERDKFQESATEFIRDVFVSKNRLRLLSDLLSSQHAVEMNVQDWVEHPRICDITADVLMQETGGKMQFPRKGSMAERDDAVARVRSALKADPQVFEGLKDERP